jgi:hypothetical protein
MAAVLVTGYPLEGVSFSTERGYPVFRIAATERNDHQ